MEDRAGIRAMWELPATWKLITLFSRVLSFSAPTPTQFEDALLNPREHMTVIANIHGRLLRLSAGASAAKNWMTYAFRFVRHRPEDFQFLPTEEEQSNVASPGISDVEMSEFRGGSIEEEKVSQRRTDDHDLIQPQRANRPFPTDEEIYFLFPASTRLLVLHNIAEIVLSEHETLLLTGSITEFDIVELRQYPIGTDAVGSKYWYFGDCERLYREPGKKVQKTRRQIADERAKAAEEIAKAAAQKAAKLVKEEKRKESERKREEIRLRREERKRKSMEKWGPRVAAGRKTRASSRAETRSVRDPGRAARVISTEPPLNNRRRQVDTDVAELDVKQNEEPYIDVESSPTRNHSSSSRVERRTSGRRRKAIQSEPIGSTVRMKKRPRISAKFEDQSLRMCESWELLSSGSSELQELISRFRSEARGVLPSEKSLVSFLEDDLLPEFLEREEKIRKDQERHERKLRNEAIFSVQKRSSRVQALELKREEEARRVAEAEEQERARLQVIAERIEALKTQAISVQREQSRLIRSYRRAYGRTEAISRDDQLHNKLNREAINRQRTSLQPATRRSSRTLRASRRGFDTTNSPSFSVEDTRIARNVVAEKMLDTEPQHSANENLQKTSGSLDEDRAKNVDISGRSFEGDELNSPDNAANLERNRISEDKNEARPSVTAIGESGHHEEGPEFPSTTDELSVQSSEKGVEDVYTWSINPDDSEPIRVLDKFFFASKADFADAPLEICETSDSTIVGFGVLLPPLKSAVDVRLVQIDEVMDWSIEYGAEPKLWVKSNSAWYELREPSVEYREAFTSTRRKYELCIRIAILGATYKSAELTYGYVVDLLSYRYEEMQSYSTADVLAEKRFIVAQMESLGRKPMLQSGFLRELKRKIRAEDFKVQAANQKNRNAPSERQIAVAKKEIGGLPNASNAQAEQTPKKPSRPKRRTLPSGKPVPRVVSSIISGVLRAATKSKARPRKQKQKGGAVKEKTDGASMQNTNAMQPNGKPANPILTESRPTQILPYSKPTDNSVTGNAHISPAGGHGTDVKGTKERPGASRNIANGHRPPSLTNSRFHRSLTTQEQSTTTLPGTQILRTPLKCTTPDVRTSVLSPDERTKRIEQRHAPNGGFQCPSETNLIKRVPMPLAPDVATATRPAMGSKTKNPNENGLHMGVQNGVAGHTDGKPGLT